MIRIHILEGKAFVWNPTDVQRIREEHRIVGTLVGALPRKPRQNVRLGLPLQLLPEEARLLAEKGVATLLKNSSPHPLADDSGQVTVNPTLGSPCGGKSPLGDLVLARMNIKDHIDAIVCVERISVPQPF